MELRGFDTNYVLSAFNLSNARVSCTLTHVRKTPPIIAIWNKEELPEEWKESVIVPIREKGDSFHSYILRQQGYLLHFKVRCLLSVLFLAKCCRFYNSVHFWLTLRRLMSYIWSTHS